MSKRLEVVLDKVCVTITDGTHLTPALADSGVPLYNGADINRMKIYNPLPAKFISRETDQGLETRCKPQGDDVLISSRGSIGKIAIVEAGQDFNIMGNIILCRPNQEKLLPWFLGYYLKGKQKKLEELAHGVAQKGLYLSTVRELEIPLPPLETQKHIAKTLDTAAELLGMRKQQLAELDNLIKSTYYDMFGDPVSNEKGWELKTLKEVCNKITDGTHFSPDNFNTGPFKYITAKNIKKDGFDLSNLTYISEEMHKGIYSRCNPQFGDVLYIKDGVTTGIAQINSLHEEFSMLSSVALLKQNRDILSAYYLREVLNNQIMYANIRENMGGAAITRLTLKKIQIIQIPLPPLTLQIKFAEIVTKIEEQKILVKNAIDETQHLFDSLMSEYFE